MRLFLAACAVVLATTSADAAPTMQRDGANHHLGDDSFVERFDRLPTDADGEKLRMRVHLAYVRERLASRPATREALSDRRAELLGYLDEYIDLGITPVNTYVTRRNPVFIDRDGRICAVGYLIERSVGRGVAEAVAATHRLDYLEDIAIAMPEVSRWIASSGFTVDELASIQPGYPGPEVMHMAGWLKKQEDDWQSPVGEVLPADGVYRNENTGMLGTIRNGKMIGTWTRTVDNKLRGKGTFENGAGTWTSFRANGTRLATGAFARSHAHGEWKIFHPSGRLAAIGRMRNGARDGQWTFFYDNAKRSKLSVGSFSGGATLGGWKHYDERGALVATAAGAAWGGLTLDVAPKDGVRREIHRGIPAEAYRLDGFYLGGERLYVTHVGEMYDGQGNRLEVVDGTWTARACTWSRKRKHAAKIGDATTLHGMLLANRWDENKPDLCRGTPVAVAPARVATFERMIASRSRVTAPVPVFDVDPQPPVPTEEAVEDDEAEPNVGGTDHPDDFATYLSNGMRWYIEWPHVDHTFVSVYASLPGYATGMQFE
jgi:hypothetical protein